MSSELIPVRSPFRALKWKSSGDKLYYGDFRITPVWSANNESAYLVHKILGHTKFGSYRYEKIAVFPTMGGLYAAKNYVETTHLLGEEP